MSATETDRKEQEIAGRSGLFPWPRPLGDAPRRAWDQHSGGRAGRREVGSGDFEIMLLVPFSLRAVC